MNAIFNHAAEYLMKGMGARGKGFRLHKMPPGSRHMKAYKEPRALLERPCFQCSEPMFYAAGQFAMTHRWCRKEFRRIHGAFKLQH